MTEIFSILSSRLLFYSSVPVTLLLILSSVLFISAIVMFISLCLFFSSSRSVLKFSCTFLIYASILFLRPWIIISIIILNSFSDRLLISSLFDCSYRLLPASFICSTFLCHLILSKLLCSFHRMQAYISSSFCYLPPLWVRFFQGLVASRVFSLLRGCHCPIGGRVYSLVVEVETLRSVSWL